MEVLNDCLGFLWRNGIENSNLGWVGLEPTTNALKGRYSQSIKFLF